MNVTALERLETIVDKKDIYYLIGYIYADGHVNKYGIYFCCAEKDKKFFFTIAKKLNVKKNKIKKQIIKEKYVSYKFPFYNKDFLNYLFSIGFILRKTYQNDDIIFKNVPDEFKQDFIRGFFDGDGCCMITKSNKGVGNFVSLNEKLLRSIKSYIESFYNNENIGRITLEKQKYYRFIFSGNRVCKKIYDILYKNICNKNIFLKRKKQKLEKAIDLIFIPKYYSYKKKSKKWTVAKTKNSKSLMTKHFDTEKEAKKFVKNNRQYIESL